VPIIDNGNRLNLKDLDSIHEINPVTPKIQLPFCFVPFKTHNQRNYKL
jgi:hypothetical protein